MHKGIGTADLGEVAVEDAARQVGRRSDQLEEADKVVVVESREGLHCKVHLRGVPHLRAELLHLSEREDQHTHIYPSST